NQILARHSGQPLERIERDTDRNYWMDPETAKEYGIIDQVILPRERTKAKGG
ncbi:MAG: ClpP family protease, partial [Candidatus Methylomirabilaceae bacterium]